MKKLADVIEDHEALLDQRDDLETMKLRAMLGDPKANAYVSCINRSSNKSLSDQVNEHLCRYRILDIEVGCCNDTGPRSSPPRQPQRIKTEDFSAVNQLKFIKKLSNWQSLLISFKKLIPKTQHASQAVIVDLNSPFRRSFAHLQCLSDDFASERMNAVVQNFRMAALHLTLLQESGYVHDTLPNTPIEDANELSLSNFLPQQDLDKYEDDTRQQLGIFIAAHPIGEFRLPLHMSLLLSMLLLLNPSKLCKSLFPRPSIHLVSPSDTLLRFSNQIFE